MREFSIRLVKWYQENKRELPWRETKDPYKIWLSEIILQQTRVAQGLPYYFKFVEKFPDVFSLAEANEQEVLRLWQGLGYYSRARNLHAAARYVANELNGKFPESYTELKKLKGVGEYTAAAIASFAYKEKVAVLDGNVFRVLARLFGIDVDIGSNEGKKVFTELANSLISEQNPDLHNQAIMEFGAMHCTPHNPNCMFCPFTAECSARLTQKQDKLPVKGKKIKKRKRYFHYLVLNKANEYFLKKRSENDIWQGLFDFPLIESEQKLDFEQVAEHFEKKEGIKKLSVSASKIFTHILTHQRIEAVFYVIKNSDLNVFDAFLSKNKANLYSIEAIEELPKPVLVSKYLKEYIF